MAPEGGSNQILAILNTVLDLQIFKVIRFDFDFILLIPTLRDSTQRELEQNFGDFFYMISNSPGCYPQKLDPRNKAGTEFWRLLLHDPVTRVLSPSDPRNNVEIKSSDLENLRGSLGKLDVYKIN